MIDNYIAMGNHVVHENTSIAECHNSNWETQRKNAKLFAAAPDLLAALQQVVKYHGVRGEAADSLLPIEEQDSEIQIAMLAINKATGETI